MKKCNIFGTFQHFKHFQTFSNIFKHFPTFSSIFQHFQLFQVNSFTMDTGQTSLDFESTTNFLQNNMQNLQQEIQTLSSYNNNTSEYVQTTMSSSLAPNTTFNPDAVHLNHHFSLLEILLIGVSSVSASLFTVLGNALVIIAFIINRQLRTINNYGRLDGNFENKNLKFFLKNHSLHAPHLIINLAIADFFVGLISMNFFAVYTIQGGWYLGPVLCDFWLTLDYVASNTSVMNLLIICIDRYLSVQHAIWYRNKRSIKHAVAAMIFSWVISLLIWGVPIIGYQFWNEKGRDLPEAQCYRGSFENEKR